jgi:hypothetical protein
MSLIKDSKINKMNESSSWRRIAGLKSFSLPFTVFDFSKNGTKPVKSCLELKGCRYGICIINGAGPFFAENGQLIDSLEIRDFGIVIYRRFASPRVRQQRGRLSPPSVAPAGPRLETAGASTPPGIPTRPPGTTSPALLFSFARNVGHEKGPGRRGQTPGFAWWSPISTFCRNCLPHFHQVV